MYIYFLLIFTTEKIRVAILQYSTPPPFNIQFIERQICCLIVISACQLDGRKQVPQGDEHALQRKKYPSQGMQGQLVNAIIDRIKEPN
jgi:hypothetical protein